MKINIGVEELKTKRFWIAVAAEAQGCFFFLICVITVALSWQPHPAMNQGGGNQTMAPPNRTSGPPSPLPSISANNVEIGIGIGLGIATLAQAYGHVSGGHLNPAVSLGMVIAGRISILKGVFYTIAQLVGAALGSLVVGMCTPKHARGTFGLNMLGKDVTPGQGFGLELIFTFFLVFFVLVITDEKKKVEPYGTTLGIGVCILVAHVCLIPYTGCGINPARSFGPAVVAKHFKDHWVYWIGPIFGAVLAALDYKFCYPVGDDNNKESNLNEERIALNEENA